MKKNPGWLLVLLSLFILLIGPASLRADEAGQVVQKGIELLNEQNYEDAAFIFKQALKMNLNSAGKAIVYWELALTAKGMGDRVEEEKYLKQFLEWAPRAKRFNIYKTWSFTSKMANAKARISGKDIKSTLNHYEAGREYRIRGQYEKAGSELENALVSLPSALGEAVIQYERFILFGKTGDEKNRMAAAKKVAELAPAYVGEEEDETFGISEKLAKVSEYLATREINPEYDDAKKDLLENRPIEALTKLDAASKKARSQKAQAQVEYLRGWAYFDLQQYADAADAFQGFLANGEKNGLMNRVIYMMAFLEDQAGTSTGEKDTDKGRLYVVSYPEGATIKIMNINPKFEQGISLKPGVYKLNVSHEGYHVHKQDVVLEDPEIKRVVVSLEPKN